jgi:predicted phage terminase large subunit-like protein
MSSANDQLPAQIDLNFLMRADLMTFTEYVFDELNPQTEFIENQFLHLLAAKLEECAAGKCKRLMICLPPRSLKSILVSVAFPAWVLGRFPHKQFICASYGQELADKHARDTRTIMASEGYQRAFQTRLSPQKHSVNDFMTIGGGFRMATSVGGVLTGRGADMLILDDLLKPHDAFSELLRNAVNSWYDNTLLSRLNNRQDGVIIVVMQRLHQDDLIGHLLEKDNWDIVSLPAIAEQDELFEAESWCGCIVFKRRAGELLDPRRDTMESLEQLRSSMGSYAFEAQYQQNPQPEGGAIIKTNWLCRYTSAEMPQHFTYKIQSWDTANKAGELNDYSVCTTWGVLNESYYLLDVYRRRLEYPDLHRAVKEQHAKHWPSHVIIEDHGSGTQLLQDLRREGMNLTAYRPPPGNDKSMRLFTQAAVFENGRVFLPTSAPWLDEYVRELTSFPGAKYDDQVDSTTQALDHLSKYGSGGARYYPLMI